MLLLDLCELCKMLKITVQTGRNRLSRGLPMPPSFRVGRRRLFVATEVDRWLIEHAGLATEPAQQASKNEIVRRGHPRKLDKGGLT